MDPFEVLHGFALLMRKFARLRILEGELQIRVFAFPVQNYAVRVSEFVRNFIAAKMPRSSQRAF
jgi:hypothetical protein